MTKGKNQHVVKHAEGWAVKGEGNSKATRVTKTQKEAIEVAEAIARNQQSDTAAIHILQIAEIQDDSLCARCTGLSIRLHQHIFGEWSDFTLDVQHPGLTVEVSNIYDHVSLGHHTFSFQDSVRYKMSSILWWVSSSLKHTSSTIF